jgi:type I restriction enzyme R subunit
MAGMEHKNLAVEALRKLLAGETKRRTRTNVLKNRQFSKRIEEAMSRYYNRVIDALQVIQEMLEIARDLRKEPDDGLTPEEVAFYDALAENGSATELMGNAELRLIASELVKAVRENAAWTGGTLTSAGRRSAPLSAASSVNMATRRTSKTPSSAPWCSRLRRWRRR